MTSYRTMTVTLTNAAQVYNLATLLLALDLNFPLTGREVTLQIDTVVAGNVRVGDGGLQAASNGLSYSAGDQRLFRSSSEVPTIPVGMFNLVADTPGMKVNVEVVQ